MIVHLHSIKEQYRDWDERVANMWRTVRKSFGIIEVLISGVIVITVIGATLSVRQRAQNEASVARHQATAFLLAQEGIEAVRSIRDTNYLAKQKNFVVGPMYKRSWDCDVLGNTSITADPGSTTGGAYFQTCNAVQPLNVPPQTGNFTIFFGGQSNTLELGNGMLDGTVFRSDTSPNQAIFLPSWHLSSPVPGYFDGGTPNGGGSTSLDADKCHGVERIFVREGSITPLSAAKPVLENVRVPGSGVQNSQDNFTSGAVVNCSDSIAGYAEYNRQVITMPAGPLNEATGNLPALWGVGPGQTATHEVLVLVRVGWNESNRATGATDQNGVLLATYLTDWRPQN